MESGILLRYILSSRT